MYKRVSNGRPYFRLWLASATMLKAQPTNR